MIGPIRSGGAPGPAIRISTDRARLSRDRPPARRRCGGRSHPPRPGGRSACRDLSARCRRPRCVSHRVDPATRVRGKIPEERVMDVTLRATRRANGRTALGRERTEGSSPMKGRRSSRSAAVVLAGCVGLAVMAPGLALAAPVAGADDEAECTALGCTWDPERRLRRRRHRAAGWRTLGGTGTGPTSAETDGESDGCGRLDRRWVDGRPSPATPETARAGRTTGGGLRGETQAAGLPAARPLEAGVRASRSSRRPGSRRRERRRARPRPPTTTSRPRPPRTSRSHSRTSRSRSTTCSPAPVRTHRLPDLPTIPQPVDGKFNERQRRLPERHLPASVPRGHAGLEDPQHPAAGLLRRARHDGRGRLPRAPA